MTIPTPPDLARGRVTWTVGRTDGTTLLGARGTVRFEATAVAVAYSSATVLPSPVETAVVAGVMAPVELVVNDPELWNWVVTPRVGVVWEPFPIDVTGPVDLATVVVVPGKGPIRAVTGPPGPAPDLSAYPTRVEVMEEIAGAVEGIDVDLTNYPTRAEVTEEIEGAVPDLSGYALKTEIPGPQTLALEGRDLSISGGNAVTLPASSLDTDWRSVPIAEMGRGIDGLSPASGVPAGVYRIRREGKRVDLVIVTTSESAWTSADTWAVPAGFRPSRAYAQIGTVVPGGPLIGRFWDQAPIPLTWESSRGIGVWRAASGGSAWNGRTGRVQFFGSWFTDDPWPATLPGTPLT